jgi:hypothetical protein
VSYLTHALAPLAIAAGVAFPPNVVFAAMHVCQQTLEGVGEDRAEIQAKRQALESWQSSARKYGEGHTRWGIAYNRQIKCVRTSEGLHRCKAVGRPCTVTYMPIEGAKRFERGAAASTDAP